MKPVIIDPNTTTRAAAFDLWMRAPNPMVTFFKTLDVTPLVRLSRRRGLKFNMLLCWCVGKAASGIREFYTLPVGLELWRYDALAVNTIVKNRTGEVSSCDVPFSDDLSSFGAAYLRLTREAAARCENHDLPDRMVIGTSAIVDTELDGAVGMNSGIFNNPFLIWANTARAFSKRHCRSRSSSTTRRWTARMRARFCSAYRKRSMKSGNTLGSRRHKEDASEDTKWYILFPAATWEKGCAGTSWLA